MRTKEVTTQANGLRKLSISSTFTLSNDDIARLLKAASDMADYRPWSTLYIEADNERLRIQTKFNKGMKNGKD